MSKKGTRQTLSMALRLFASTPDCSRKVLFLFAAEIRADRLGYAVFELPQKFIDFGAASFDSPVTAKPRITRLLRIFRPSLLILRKPDARRRQQALASRMVAKAARSESRRLAIPIVYVSARTSRKYYQRYSCRNKYDVAALLSDWYPDIAWRLPKKRKFYGPEPRVMIYFDSAALAAVHLGIAEGGRTKSP